MRVIPGDPIIMMVPPGEITLEQIERLRHIYGLDRPIHIQYIEFISSLFTGDWGVSLFTTDRVLPLLLHRFQATLQLALASILFASIIGVSLGALSIYKSGIYDSISQFISTIGYSIPNFWLGISLITIFSVYLGWFPAIGGGDLKHLILPAITNGTWATAVNIRVSRASMLEVLSQDYVVLGRAKGLSRRLLLQKYILPNALIPIVTVIGLQFGLMMGGSIITERVFQYPGIGNLLVESIFKRDYPVIQGGVFLIATIIVTINLFIDLIYMILDPRVRYEKD
jgi:peptide/nickel transport system permease protein